MPADAKQTLYIFIDESGNFDFSPNGTKYFVLTAVSTLSPLQSREKFLRKVYELKYQEWNEGESDYYFHATEDKQVTRDWMFEHIKGLNDIQIDAVVAQKNKVNPSLYIRYEPQPHAKGWLKARTTHSEEKFYEKISQILLRYVCTRHHDKDHIEKIVVVLGSLFTGNKRGYVLKSLKQYFKNQFKKPFYVYFHSTASDINCQIADYCGWALYVAWERSEQRPLQEIESKVQSCFNVFEKGTTEYYDYEK